MNLKELWQAALGEIELGISKANFITWFKNTEISSKKNGVVIVNVPNGFTKEWLENKYNKLIFRALRNISQDIKEVQFIIGTPLPLKPFIKQRKELPKTQPEEQLGFEEFNVDKETNLNPKYTFDNFIIGSFNELAQAAARAVTKHLGTLYNPLFIYGGVGLGEKPLLQAIGNELNKKHPLKKIKYLSSEKYMSELVDAISKKGMESFKPKYRKIDVLIIDDIQFIAGKEKTQEEFFHTFNALYQKNKQIIISSDRPPKAIPTIEERLSSRFEGGMIADISYPDVDKAKKILSGIISKPKKLTNFKDIIKAVAEFYDINTNDLINKCRRKEIVRPRQISMYLIRKELNGSFPYIGEKLGGRDHTTAMYSYEKINKDMENNEALQQEINLIKERIYN